jgi:hypothetical protein
LNHFARTIPAFMLSASSLSTLVNIRSFAAQRVK